MKKQIISEEFVRMQKLAGLITESEYKAKLNEKEGGSGLNYDDLIQPLLKLYKNPEYSLGDNFESEEELYNGLKGKYIVSELLAYDLGSVLEDYLRKNNKIVIDGVDYTDYYWESVANYVTDGSEPIANFIRLLYPDIKADNAYFIEKYEDLDTFFEMWDELSNLSMHTQSDIIELAQESGVSQSDISYILDLPQVSKLEKG